MKKARVIIDFAMMMMLIMLMAYSLIGETLHEIVGTLIFALLPLLCGGHSGALPL